jgi:hypothetical protein
MTSATKPPLWPERESRVHQPGSGLLAFIGGLFLLAGITGFFTLGANQPPGLRFWAVRAATSLFALLGGAALTAGVARLVLTVRVRHAAADVLADVPREPVLWEGSVVHGRLTHELAEDAAGWEFRTRQSLWRSDRRFLWGFGVPFLTIFATGLSWVFFRDRMDRGWAAAIVPAVVMTLGCGGTAIVLMGLMSRAGYRRLCHLRIPAHGPLELDAPEQINVERADPFKWVFVGDTQRHRLAIPREMVQAVQLCPWKYACGEYDETVTWAAQGLLVLQPADGAAYWRVPILLTGDFVGAARLVGQLADVLGVPYVFNADAAGWKAEAARAHSRPPQRVGGVM